MSVKVLSLTVCALIVLLSLSNNTNAQQDSLRTPPKFDFAPPTPRNNDFKVFGNGGGSPKTGVDLNLGAQAKIWESQNHRNTLHGTGTYSQHLGGPYGNSRPNYGGGLTFTHHF